MGTLTSTQYTATIYLRDDPAAMAAHGSSIQSTAAGLPAPTVAFNKVRLRDGTEVTPRSHLTTAETGQGTVSVMEQVLVDQVLPSTQDVTNGECLSTYPHYLTNITFSCALS